jgi:uncharacterized protein (DUF1501 family)
MYRRSLLKAPLAAAFLPLGRSAWAMLAEDGPRRLIVIMLRGAVDGLNVVVPHTEAAYYRARRSIAIAGPGKPDGALPLDTRFGLHPALSGLMPLWRAGNLAFIHAAGSSDPTRSHFAAQRYIENGTPGNDSTPDGWMNRLLSALPGPHPPTEAISVGSTLPRILSGKAPATNFPLDPEAARPSPIDDTARIGSAFDRLYAATDALSRAYHEGREARAQLVADLATEQRIADAGAPEPRSFPAEAARLAHLIRRDPSIRVAFFALGGWDTHVNEGASSGQLANRLRPLGDGIAALALALGRAWRDTAVVVLSEFGRTVAENGDGGTDHGHGNVIWVAGGAIAGGRVYGDWPGLSPEQLYQRRDLAITTDFRAVLAALLTQHLRLSAGQVAMVLPGLSGGDPQLASLVAA